MADKITPEFLQAEYVVKRRSALDIANELQVACTTVRRKLDCFNIPKRNIREARLALIANRTEKIKHKKYRTHNIQRIEVVDLRQPEFDGELIRRLLLDIKELVADMEPLEDLLTGMRLNYDILMEKKNLLGIDKDIVIALDLIAAEG